MTRLGYVILPVSLLLSALLVMGCRASSLDQVLESGESQVKLRQMQTRAFDTTDKDRMLRVVISTLQDLTFVVDKADKDLGTVSATKLDQYSLRMTVTVRPRGTAQLLVRANAQYNIVPVTDPKTYQDFFASLSKALFLEAHAVE